MIGRTLGNRYRIEAQLGSGAMGAVYRAHDPVLNRAVGIKVITSGLLTEESRSRFLREAQTLATLSHPNIVTIHDFGYEGDSPYLVMELLAGCSLRTALKTGVEVSIRPLAKEVCHALACAHEKGIIHRDLKPENVFLTASGAVKLVDFGLSRLLDQSRLSKSEAFIGTIAYASPEQIKGEEVDPRSDLYSLGLILYELVAGHHPFADCGAAAMVHKHLNEMPPPFPAEKRVDDAFAHIIFKLLAKDKKERFSSALQVEEALETNQVSATTSASNNLPLSLTTFIGREKEINEVARLLENNRLVTLTGAGGCGKTRLALELARRKLTEYRDGIWLAELAPLTDADLVPQAVASSLGIREEPNKPVMRALTEAVRGKRMLLVLDNCEHVIGACASAAESLLKSSENVALLATSREPLNIGGEVTWRVPSLSLPDQNLLPASAELLSDFESVRLFVERACAAQPDFRLTEQNAPTVAAICLRLDGIPLAIELAAARVRALSVEQILERLDHRFQLLTTGSRTSLPRQQTLRALIDWSYELLSEPEKILLRRLSIFAGGWTLEAAEQICSAGPSTFPSTGHLTGDRAPGLRFRPASIAASQILDLLSQLVDRSLVLRDSTGQPRYRMLEIIREYAREKLSVAADSEEVRKCYAEWFLRLAERAEPNLRGQDQQEWLDRLEAEHDNLRAALQWSLREGNDPECGFRIASAIHRFWYVRGYFTEGLRWLEEALAKCPNVADEARAKVLNEAGVLSYGRGDYIKAREFYEQSLQIRRRHDDREGMAACLNNLGIVAEEQEDYDSARSFYEQSLSVYRALGNESRVATVLSNLGVVAKDSGDCVTARTLLEESLTIHQRLNNRGAIAIVLINLGDAARRMGDFAAASTIYAESLNLVESIGHRRNLCILLRGTASLVAEQGNLAEAARLFSAVQTFGDIIGLSCNPRLQQEQDSIIKRARAALGRENIDAAWDAGAKMNLQEATAFARKALQR